MSQVSALAAFPAGESYGAAAPPAQQILNFVLFITMLTSSLVFIEPSAHDALVLLLIFACIGARRRFDRMLIPLLLLLTLWFIGGCLSLVQVGDNQKDVQYIVTSLYLDVAAITFACLFSDGNLARLNILRRAYIFAALFATALGFVGFFHLAHGSDVFLTYGRVSATFKDPNVYGPYLILPLLFVTMGLMTRGARFFSVAILAALLGGLFLSFSRGAWFHFALSAIVATAILLAVTRDRRLRRRILIFATVGAIVTALIVAALMSMDSVSSLFDERAKAIQSYDVGPGGRFWLQQLALNAILNHPFGLGPFEFDRIFGLQQHNVYMQGFLVYSWLGGVAYIAIIVVTLVTGLRAVLVPTPWQNYLIAAYAGFVGKSFEGFIVDTDHWRHFFLLLGLVWGLTVATINLRRRRAWGLEAVDTEAMLPATS